MKNIFNLLSYAIIILLIASCQITGKKEIFIRSNQHGYLPGDIKSAVILSNSDLSSMEYKIRDIKSNKISFKNKLNLSSGAYGKFSNVYYIDFSPLTAAGEYEIDIDGVTSYKFKIGDKLYQEVVDTLMQFFRVQRCGFTNPHFHDICHKSDAHYIIDGKDTIRTPIDLTGGWHDAGDYIKFLNTTAFTTYTLLFTYEFNPQKFNFDNDGNGIPDLLDEAKIGLDWMMRANYEKYKFISQVQDMKDHDVGWRLPENDPLEYNRPAYVGNGKNIAGMYIAAMSIAYRIWNNVLNYPSFADKCLTSAENILSVINSFDNVDSSGSGVYWDKNYEGKLALGYVEYYEITQQTKYLDLAKEYASKIGSEYWWSYGDIAAYSHYKIALRDTSYTKYIENNLAAFKNNLSAKTFNEATEYSWGTNHTLLGAALQNILWKRLTGRNDFDSVSVFQRDFVLGRNAWGVSFIEGIGTRFSRKFHHQVAKLNGKRLPGGFAAGPVKAEFLKNFDIKRDNYDPFVNFQTENAVYYDDWNDYITNEPTIVGNATAVFVMGNFKK
ncbi:MAG: glycoside hydrolase family 9 protein [Bacteroidetes bacterium]|nr:glycoside hydrolase family 9 protein [Bacteroidota bacterium]